MSAELLRGAGGYTEVYASAARTATPTTVKFDRERATAIYLRLDLTAFVTAASLTAKVFALDGSDNRLFEMLGATAVTANGTTVYLTGESVGINGATGGGVTTTRPHPLPQRMEIEITHGNGNSHTYSAGLYRVRR